MRKNILPTRRGSVLVAMPSPCRQCGYSGGLALPIGIDRWFLSCGRCDTKSQSLAELPTPHRHGRQHD